MNSPNERSGGANLGLSLPTPEFVCHSAICPMIPFGECYECWWGLNIDGGLVVAFPVVGGFTS